MTEPAFRSREDMREYLKSAGFDDQQIRSILQVVAELMKELDPPTRADLAKSEQRSEERHEQAEKRSEEHEKRSDERYEQLKALIEMHHQASEGRHQISLERYEQLKALIAAHRQDRDRKRVV